MNFPAAVDSSQDIVSPAVSDNLHALQRMMREMGAKWRFNIRAIRVIRGQENHSAFIPGGRQDGMNGIHRMS